MIRFLESLSSWGGVKRDVVFLILSGLALAVSLIDPTLFPIHPAWAAIVLCGVPILLEAVIGLVTAFDIKADVLVSIALIASVAIGEIFAAGEVAFIMQLGGLLEELTVARARAGIERLVRLTPRTARRLTEAGEEIISADAVRKGDRLRVLPGETIPVDGFILTGQTSINQAVMTGEPLPVDKGPGDEVSSGTVNQFGSFDMEAVRVGEDSSIQRYIRLVQSADAGKAKIVGLADRWATWIVVIALSAALLTWLITGEIIRAVTILVVFCPCALVLATPTAIMAAIGNATRHGFLVREGDALERLASVTQVTFDKTGTLTQGTPAVTAVCSLDPARTWQEVYRLAADGREVLAGSPALLAERGIPQPPELAARAAPWLERGCTLICLAADGAAAGFLALADQMRPQAAETIRGVKAAGVTPVLLTGDHENAARTIARNLDIPVYQANCRPEDKLDWIDRSQQAGHPVCMVGDGINDAPALKKALVGIAMGGVGSDIAVDAADIALVNDDLRELPHLLRLSRRMMTTIKYNLTFSMALNFAAILLAITGILNPVVGALVHNAGSVLVIVNSARLLGFRQRGM